MKELFPKLDIHGGEWYPLCDNTYEYYLDKKAEHGGAWVRIIKRTRNGYIGVSEIIVSQKRNMLLCKSA